MNKCREYKIQGVTDNEKAKRGMWLLYYINLVSYKGLAFANCKYTNAALKLSSAIMCSCWCFWLNQLGFWGIYLWDFSCPQAPLNLNFNCGSQTLKKNDFENLNSNSHFTSLLSETKPHLFLSNLTWSIADVLNGGQRSTLFVRLLIWLSTW